MVQHGTMVSAFQLGGLYLFQDYVGDPSPGPFPAFVGKGYWGYNTSSNLTTYMSGRDGNEFRSMEIDFVRA